MLKLPITETMAKDFVSSASIDDMLPHRGRKRKKYANGVILSENTSSTSDMIAEADDDDGNVNSGSHKRRRQEIEEIASRNTINDQLTGNNADQAIVVEGGETLLDNTDFDETNPGIHV
jgi:hypothetical protein